MTIFYVLRKCVTKTTAEKQERRDAIFGLLVLIWSELSNRLTCDQRLVEDDSFGTLKTKPFKD